MNKNAKAWVAALRSGQYGQAIERLKDGNSNFCCLGVACELAVKAGLIKRVDDIYFADEKEYSEVMPTKVALWLGVKERNLGLDTNQTWNGSYRGVGCLAELNDSGASFEEIADIIERDQKEIFNS